MCDVHSCNIYSAWLPGELDHNIHMHKDSARMSNTFRMCAMLARGCTSQPLALCGGEIVKQLKWVHCELTFLLSPLRVGCVPANRECRSVIPYHTRKLLWLCYYNQWYNQTYCRKTQAYTQSHNLQPKRVQHNAFGSIPRLSSKTNMHIGYTTTTYAHSATSTGTTYAFKARHLQTISDNVQN